MKTFKLRFIALLIALSAVTACSIDDGDRQCFNQAAMTTLSVTGPTETTINTPITLQVTFRVANSCGNFNRFMEGTAFPKNVVALVDYAGCDCEPTPQASQTKPYVFKATTAGTYELKFLQENNLFISKTITVTAE
jgi:hypothetical protein